MRFYIDGIVIVEGTSDSSYLSSFIDAFYIETNGYDINKEDIDFIIYSNKKTIVLTDSDEAGDLIRKRLLELLPKSIDIRVNSNCCNKNGKHGVAECEKQEILNVLKEHFTNKENAVKELHLIDLINATNGQKEIKNQISKIFHLGTTNNKEIIKRLNLLDVDRETLMKEANKLNGNK